MTRLSTLEANENFADLVERVATGKERIVLTQADREVVALVPLEDLALVESLEDRSDLEEARASLRETAESGTVSLAELKRELGF
jgi:prevent-host-death family protein